MDGCALGLASALADVAVDLMVASFIAAICMTGGICAAMGAGSSPLDLKIDISDFIFPLIDGSPWLVVDLNDFVDFMDLEDFPDPADFMERSVGTSDVAHWERMDAKGL